MEDELNTSEPLADGVDVAPSDGSEADSDVASLAEVLGQALGKDFKDDQSALKAVKDTFSYVGEYGKIKPVLETKFGGVKGFLSKMEEQIQTPAPEQKAPEVDMSKFVPREQYETDTFFSQNPDYQPHRELIDALRSKTGKALSEVVQLDSFKTVFDKVKLADESEKSKSVMHSNPRLGQATDKISEARQMVKENPDAAADIAVDAVLNAYDLK